MTQGNDARNPSTGGKRSFASYREFWPYYVGAHRKHGTRVLHFVGTTSALLLIAATIVLSQPWLLVAVPFASYGPAWIGHFAIEGNTPATFEHPLYSLVGDFQMYGLMWTGRMAGEVERVAGPS